MSTDAMRAALEKLYAAVVRAHVTGTSIRYDHYAMVEARAALAQPVSAERVPLTPDRLQDVMLQHFGGRELSDDEADSAEAFARAIERAHDIGVPKC